MRRRPSEAAVGQGGMAADIVTDRRNRNISLVRGLRGALALWIVVLLSAGCAHPTEVRYQVPLDSDEARLCARVCSKRYPAEHGSYARCLGTCPGAVERDDAKCPPPRAEAKMACAEDRREDVGLAAIVGSTVVVGTLALLALLQ